METDKEELEADIEKLQHTLEEDRNQFQYDYAVVSSDEDESDDDALFIDMEKKGSLPASLYSTSLRSVGKD